MSSWDEEGKYKSPLEHVQFIPQEERLRWFFDTVLHRLSEQEVDVMMQDSERWSKLLDINSDNFLGILFTHLDYADLRKEHSMLRQLKRRVPAQSIELHDTHPQQWQTLANRAGRVARKMPGPDEMGLPQEED